MVEIVVWIIAIIIQSLIFAFATDSVIYNRGYKENWFWWGFFFGFIALIVALSKPDINQKEKAKKRDRKTKNNKAQEELLNLQKLNEYKKMLDSGIITQEYFDSKKKQLLGL